MLKRESFKIAIIGLGRVGMTTAYALLLKGIPSELILLSRSKEKAEAERLDLEHGQHFFPEVNVIAANNYSDLKGTDLVIITAGCSQLPGQTRLDLTKNNCLIIDKIGKKIKKYAPRSIVLMVTNPVDILTDRMNRLTGFTKGRVFGTGTLLDTMRYRFHLGEKLGLHPSSIHTYILGEHGDHSFPALSAGTIGGVPINEFKNFNEKMARAAYEQTKTAAYKIIEGKGATYYGISTAITYIADTIKRDTKKVLPVSIPQPDHHTAISLPCVIGRNGVEQIINIPLSEKEKQQLKKAIQTLDEIAE